MLVINYAKNIDDSCDLFSAELNRRTAGWTDKENKSDGQKMTNIELYLATNWLGELLSNYS